MLLAIEIVGGSASLFCAAAAFEEVFVSLVDATEVAEGLEVEAVGRVLETCLVGLGTI